MSIRSANRIVGAVLIVVFAFGTVNYSGICLSRMKFLSDYELIEPVFKELDRERIEASGRKTLPYRSLTEYMAANPDCCRVRSGHPGIGPDFWDRVTGTGAYVVSVDYYRRWIGQTGEIVTSFASNSPSYVVSPCGRPAH